MQEGNGLIKAIDKIEAEDCIDSSVLMGKSIDLSEAEKALEKKKADRAAAERIYDFKIDDSDVDKCIRF